MYAFHRARFPTLLGIAWFRAGAMGTHVAGFFSLVVAFGFHTETPRPGERVLRLYTSENSQSDPHCLAPWKMVFLYQPVVFRVHGIVFQGVFRDRVFIGSVRFFRMLRYVFDHYCSIIIADMLWDRFGFCSVHHAVLKMCSVLRAGAPQVSLVHSQPK